MTMARAWYVRCDGHPRGSCGNPADISTTSRAEAKTLAEADGFLRLGDRTFLCPWGCRQAYEQENGLPVFVML